MTDLLQPAARPVRKIGDQKPIEFGIGFLVATVLIAFLYVGREAFEPLAIAALLSMILAPLIRRLRRLGGGRVSSVIIAVFLAIAALGALGFTIVVQITELAEDLPKYQDNLLAKARALRGAPLTSEALERASSTLKDLEKEIAKPDGIAGKTQQAPALGAGQDAGAAVSGPAKPVIVEIRQPEPKILEAVGELVRPLLWPLATIGLVILFLVFILVQREDLRDRLLRLAGTTDLQRSTAAMNDAATRLSRFFLTQTALNVSFGAIIGIGLWLIGVPSPALWGTLAGLMRFVPFIGTFIAAAFPIALAAAVDPGWSMVLWTAALFLITEPLAAQVVEPMVYGHNTGLSPAAVVIATLFWTLLWGPVGLLLATPLTVCLVVLGKHIEGLTFLYVLLGDEPALVPEERFYQRVLAGDATEAADQAEQELKTQALSAYYDAVAMKALALAQADATNGALTREKQLEIRDTIEEIIDDLADYADEPPARAEKAPDLDVDGGPPAGLPSAPVIAKNELAPDWHIAYPVLCIASRSALDQSASALFAQVLEKHGIAAYVQPYVDVASVKAFKVDAVDARIVCLSYFGAATSPVHVRYLIRRLRRVMPEARFLAGFWLLEEEASKAEDWRASVGADFVATSLSAAVAICIKEALAAAEATVPSKDTRSEAENLRRVKPFAVKEGAEAHAGG